jgi:hypothetical protein
MAISNLDLTSLKRAKNAVIGNPHAKAALAQDNEFLALSVTNTTGDPPILKTART